MGRNLVVFSDGTGNSASTPFKSNVWRLYQALDLSSGDQIAAFDDGVGTSGVKPLRVLGLALGIGLKRNVIDLYKFLCRNWQPGDRIYGFGFSRGAFTIRTLNGLINREGLVSFKSEEELDRNALAAYRSFRKEAFREAWPWISIPRWLRDQAIGFWSWLTGVRGHEEVKTATIAEKRRHIDVHFLGLWDTVAAYGLPIDELTRAVDKWIWPMSFRDRRLPDNVKSARQALSLDDERRTFCPIPWNEAEEPAHELDQPLDNMRLLQVWFAGVHANVGGGYPNDGLAHVTLCWMIAEAHKRGLSFKNWVVAGYAAIASPYGPIYDSRAGLAAYYRYQPRDVRKRMGDGIIPLVDASVVLRIADGNDGYAPISLPQEIHVLTPRGYAIDFTSDAAVSTNPIRMRDMLPLPKGQERDLDAEIQALRKAICKLRDGDDVDKRADLFEVVGDLVWWRRVVYFVTLGLTMLIALYPVFSGNLHSRITELGDAATGVWMVIVIDLARGFLPDFAAPWLSAISKHPAVAGMIGLGIVASLWLSMMLRVRIGDRARTAWSVQARALVEDLDRLRRDAKRRAFTFGAVFFGFMAAFAASASTQPWTDDLPFMSKLFGAAAFCCFTGMTWNAHSTRASRHVGVDAPGWLLAVARIFRTTEFLRDFYRGMTRHVLPFLFLFLIGYVAICLIIRGSFDVANSLGEFCKPSTELAWAPGGKGITIGKPFATNEPCWPSGVAVVEGARYRIWLKMPDGLDWFDRGVHTDIGGFSPNGLLNHHVAATLLKRWWGQEWFKPIARIGSRGSDEYPLDPIDTLPAQAATQICVLPSNRETRACDGDHFVQIPEPIARSETARESRLAERRILSAEIKARSTGELFFYVNDAVWLPGYWRQFYGNNTGTAEVTIERITAPSPPAR